MNLAATNLKMWLATSFTHYLHLALWVICGNQVGQIPPPLLLG